MRRTALLVTLLLVACAVAGESVSGDVEIRSAERNLYLNSQVVREYSRLVLANAGSDAVTSFHLVYRAEQAEKISMVWAMVDSKELSVERVEGKVEGGAGASSDDVYYRVALGQELASQAQVTVTVGTMYTHSLVPKPRKIEQADSQLVLFEQNHYLYLAYPAQSMTTVMELASETIQSYSEHQATAKDGRRITHGPYSDVAPYSYAKMHVHSENNTPFVSTSMTRLVEVSHWGAVSVEEYHELRHNGAELKSGFSRFDYQRQGNSARHAVRGLVGVLPEGAADVYYRDEIGNVSTSHVNYEANEGVVFQMVPRFPLFGGWKVSNYFGYTLPASLYLSTSMEDASVHMLNVSLTTSLQQLVVDELEVKVILPEGASDFEVHTPFAGVKQVESETHYTYLDTVGRPVLVLKASNLVPEHARYFQVTYRFSGSNLIVEPLLLISAYFVFFVLCMVWVRLEFSIGENKELSAYESKVKRQDLVFQLVDLLERRDAAVEEVQEGKAASVDELVKEHTEIIASLEELDAGVAATATAIKVAESKKLAIVRSIGQAKSAKNAKKIKELSKDLDASNVEIKGLVDELMASVDA